MITTLDVVNGCLGTMGEAPLASVNDAHPLVASALRVLDLTNEKQQTKGWWFNTELVTLTPDAVDSYIYLPTDTLNADPIDPYDNFVQRGRRLYQATAADSVDKYVFTKSVIAKLIRLIPFDDLPSAVQQVVEAATLLQFQLDYDADSMKVQMHRARYTEAMLDLKAMDIRNRNINLLKNSSAYAKLSAIRPSMGTGRMRTGGDSTY